MTIDPPEFDEALAADLPGKVVLIGVTYLNRSDQVRGQRQWVGRIACASRDGIVVDPDDSDERCVLPPSTAAFRPAKPGIYRLRHSSREITDPDFVTTWTHKQHGERVTEFRPPAFSAEWIHGDPHDS